VPIDQAKHQKIFHPRKRDDLRGGIKKGPPEMQKKKKPGGEGDETREQK